jgi:hypothetical protein
LLRSAPGSAISFSDEGRDPRAARPHEREEALERIITARLGPDRAEKRARQRRLEEEYRERLASAFERLSGWVNRRQLRARIVTSAPPTQHAISAVQFERAFDPMRILDAGRVSVLSADRKPVKGWVILSVDDLDSVLGIKKEAESTAAKKASARRKPDVMKDKEMEQKYKALKNQIERRFPGFKDMRVEPLAKDLAGWARAQGHRDLSVSSIKSFLRGTNKAANRLGIKLSHHTVNVDGR